MMDMQRCMVARPYPAGLSMPTTRYEKIQTGLIVNYDVLGPSWAGQQGKEQTRHHSQLQTFPPIFHCDALLWTCPRLEPVWLAEPELTLMRVRLVVVFPVLVTLPTVVRSPGCAHSCL